MRAWVVGAVAALVACNHGSSNNNVPDMSGGGGAGGGQVMVTANMLNGPTPMGPHAKRLSVPAPQASSNNKYVVSPDKVQMTIKAVQFCSTTAGTCDLETVSNCVVTYDRSDYSLANRLSCPFMLRAGTYNTVLIEYSRTFQVLINDAVNGIFTDPTSPTMLSTTAPAGGAQYVPYTVMGGDVTNDIKSFLTLFLKTPLVVGEGDAAMPPSLDVVMHALHIIGVTVGSAGALSFNNLSLEPVALFPSVSGIGKVTFYSSSGTALNYGWNSSVLPPTELFVIYDTSGAQQVFMTGWGTVLSCNSTGMNPGGAQNISPSESPVGMGGGRSGGYVGTDTAGNLCWALPKDNTWAMSDSLWKLPEVATVGGSATIACMQTASAPAPTSGDTYASGCPTFTPTATEQVMLVAH